jgi:GNAT superfamily N-acetyltransferase
MSRRLVSLTLDTLGDVPAACRTCVFWELDPAAHDRAHASGETAFEKEAWLSTTLLQWGSCGTVLYVDEVPAGFSLYAPPGYFPRSSAFPTSPVSADAVLLATTYVEPEFRGNGYARILLQTVAKDLLTRNVRAIEAFGSSLLAAQDCVLPADHLLAVGFKTVRPHARWPRLRMDLRSTVTWREDVEVAFEKLLGTVTAVAADRRSGRRLTPAAP